MFWSWILYGMVQGWFAFYAAFWSLETPTQTGLISSTVAVNGQLVYFGVVLLANIKILWSTNTHTFYSFILNIGSILSFLVLFNLGSRFDFHAVQDIYKMYSPVFDNPLCYLTMLFIMAGLGIMDNGWVIVKGVFLKLTLDKEKEMQKAVQRKVKMEKKNNAVVYRRVTKLECKLTTTSLIYNYRPRIRILAGARTGASDHGETHNAHCQEGPGQWPGVRQRRRPEDSQRVWRRQLWRRPPLRRGGATEGLGLLRRENN